MNVIWIDQNNNKEENKGYLKKYSKELNDFSFILTTSVQEGYNKLSKFSFKLVYVILSGRLAEEFLDKYEENLQQFNLITLNIIFCYHQSKKYANDPFYNPGGLVTEFKDVINFLKKNKKIQINGKKYERGQLDPNFIPFIFIPNEPENYAFPIILKKFSSRLINDEELVKFKHFLLYNYFEDKDEMNNVLSCQIKIPHYLYTNIFLRIYTMGIPFYRDLNIALSNNNFLDFKQFIFTLYSGLNLNIIKNCHDVDLFRAQYISNELYDKLKDNRLILCRNFLSFAKNKEVAISFSKYFSKPNGKIVLFVVKALKEKKNVTVTNIDTEKISFCEEKEVIFPPFSGFEISDINEEKDPIEIHLDYLNKYEKKIIDYIDENSKDNVGNFLKNLIEKSNKSSIFKNLFPKESLNLIKNYENKKNVLWIDQYSRCKVYDDYLIKYSDNLKDFYFERATTIEEAYSILSNYEFKMIYVIINDKLAEKFFSQYEKKIKLLGVVTANIIFCEKEPEIKNKYINDSFFNPGKIVTDFSKVVAYLNTDECGFKDILKLKATIDRSFAGNNYGNIFKQINEKQIDIPINTINKIISHLPSKESISVFKNFIFTYGINKLSKVVNPTLEKKINIPLFIYPKFFMRLYGLQTPFYPDLNKYLSNRQDDFGIFDTFVTILYYGLTQDVLISNNEFPFYRGGVISKKEFNIINQNIKSKDIFYSCKSFLSFSKSDTEAYKFLQGNLECGNSLFPALFIIEKYENIKGNNNCSYLMSNVEMRHYSSFASEKEVLFFPLSSFRITKLSDDKYLNTKIKIIKLNYVGILLK